MRKLVCYLILFLHFCFAGKAFNLSDSCEISLLTCSPGNELYSAFGHSGIRIKDYKQDFDYVFNYGVFNFNQPDFYTNFLKGKMLYSIGVDDFSSFLYAYNFEKRDIFEQKLHYSNEEIKKIFAYLDNNLQPQNRNYRYDFLLDNCSTRLLDVFNKNGNEKIKLNFSNLDATKTFRQLINDYSNHLKWSQLGMNLLIGEYVDRKISYQYQLFLPDNLMKSMNSATFQPSGKMVAASPNVLLQAYEPLPNSFFTEPIFVFSTLLLLLIAVLVFAYKNKKSMQWLSAIILSLYGFLGLLFAVMWGFTEHYTTYWNYNLLWANPITLLAAFSMLFFYTKKITQWLLYCVGALLLVFWLFNFVLSQSFIIPIYIIAAIVSVIVFYQLLFFKNNKVL